MKIAITDGKRLIEKRINENNSKISFEYYDYLDYFVFEYKNNNLIMNNNYNYYEIISDDKSGVLELYSKMKVKSRIDNVIYNIYVLPDYDDNYSKFRVKTDEVVINSKSLILGNILLDTLDFSMGNIKFIFKDNNICMENTTDYAVYVNNIVNLDGNIKYGDIIFINGIIVVFISKIMYVYNSNTNIVFDMGSFEKLIKREVDLSKYEEITDIKYVDNNTFNTSPIIKKNIVSKKFSIDPPSQVELKEGNPLLLTMMPMVLMSSTSVMMSLNIINNIRDGKTTWEDNKISLLFSAVMIFSMILYPIIQNIYKKHKESKREIRRIEEYKDYIYEYKLKIGREIDEQRNILLNNFKDTKTSVDTFYNNIEQIWDKKSEDEDFLVLSLGKGNKKPNLEINYPEEHFTIDRDKLRIQITKLQDEVEYIKDCPILLNMNKNNNVSFIGERKLLYSYIRSLLIRLFLSHSYNDIRLCVFSDEEHSVFWNEYSHLPYFWNDDRNLRFFGYDTSSISNIVNYLDVIYKERVNEEKLNKNNLNYIILIDNFKVINEIVFLKELLSSDKKYGFNIIFLAEKIGDLPSGCKNFIKLDKNNSKLIVEENNYKEISFIPDIYDVDFTNIYKKLSTLYNGKSKNQLPNKITFLEMYKVDGVDKLNVIDKWNNNTTLENMSVPIGVNEYGNLVQLDLHENAHGPHGLIAGMTGSGKSEFIISLILSLSINYSPQDVQFVLIDYKGGGLSNTFYSNELALRLPHIVGVITNISESEINRCLISLQSEMKRRQVLFSQASLKYNEGNMDIYKYQQLAKSNKELEYLSHLLIISDEFAELKTQNPEFIDKLISLARIGRSLGIHLILSTQKPSGVVDSQIWSNSKFKVCLKVQDKSDSKEVIGVDDAVYLTNPGRFYLQIGYNELFLKGQCAHSGAPYYLSESTSKLSNYRLDFVNEYGKTYYSYSNFSPDETIISGTHVSNIVKYLIEKSLEVKYNIKSLWKDSLEEKIYLDNLLKKYNYHKKEDVEIVFGEYDEVDNRKTGLASYSLVNSGNIIIYGLTGTGKAELIQTAIFFLLKNYLVEDVNIYVMDFSLENNKIFSSYPQVGDVMYLYEREKIINTFKYVNSILNERKNILSNYSGGITEYNKENEVKMPIIFIIISGLERLFENFNELENVFADLTRDCNKFGITFMVSVSSITGVRNKLIGGFKQVISLELKDKYDYDAVFGTKVNYSIQHIFGRGFIKKGKVYEMQSARILPEEDNLFEYIENHSFSMLSRDNISAPEIPVLPAIVTYDIMKKYLVNSTTMPLGINVDSLNVVNFEFLSKLGTIITGNDMQILENYIKSLIKNINSFKENKTYLFVDDDTFKVDGSITISDNFSQYFEQLMQFIENSDKNINYFVIFKSLAHLLDILDLKGKALLYDLITKLKLSNNFYLILVDMTSSIKKYEYSEFYTSNFSNTRGIFIGSGLAEQYILKVNRIPRQYRDIQEDNYGFCIENNKLECMKIMEYDKNE